MKVVEIALANALKGNGALTTKLGGEYIYNSVAPQGQAFPYIVFLFTGGGPENITPSDMRDMSYLVKGVSDSLKESAEIDELVEDVLHNQSLAVTGYTNLWTRRDNAVQLNEQRDDGTMIFHRGAYYAILLDA